MTMTSADLQALHTRLCEQGRKLMERKNTDYKAGSGDPFANFRMASLLHVNPAIGAMVRMQDKMARLVSFIETGRLAVSEESWKDCIVDLINYSVILYGLLDELSVQPVEAPKVVRCCQTCIVHSALDCSLCGPPGYPNWASSAAQPRSCNTCANRFNFCAYDGPCSWCKDKSNYLRA